MLKQKIKELITLLEMEDGLPMIHVYAEGRVRYSVVADAEITRILLELKTLAEEPSEQEESETEEAD